MAMPFPDEEIEAARRAIASNARVMEIGGDRVEFHTKTDMLKAFAFMISQNQAAVSIAAPRRYSLATFYRDEANALNY